MRRGRACHPHPAPLALDGGRRILVSRQLFASQTGLHIDMVRRRVPPVACDVRTRAWLIELAEAERLLGEAARVASQDDTRLLTA